VKSRTEYQVFIEPLRTGPTEVVCAEIHVFRTLHQAVEFAEANATYVSDRTGTSARVVPGIRKIIRYGKVK
jgi:hypothetical protein